ncbi:MAG: hypothetical protein ACD_76C00029G0009 [uncultured bacterium]|nr:MAG: hypothetical protein ACD_76C00029G0009 [uncultured bacterium]HBD05244.1 hypothetical protein [Candidatus Uhrbacteria bacterium]
MEKRFLVTVMSFSEDGSLLERRQDEYFAQSEGDLERDMVRSLGFLIERGLVELEIDPYQEERDFFP